MERLPDGERAVLELVALDELSLAEAAAAVGIRPVAARVRLHRARRKLRDELGAATEPAPSQPSTRKEDRS
jgi:RNA polymerase sigma-70 factor (ECF subfamily)